MEHALDISAWQGVISARTFINFHESISNIFLRSSYTSWDSFSLHRDKCFVQNLEAAYKSNARIGVYHYSQAISETEAIAEAKYVIDLLQPYKRWIQLPVAFDWEFGGRLSSYKAKQMGKQRCKQICAAFCREIRKAGYKPLVYANLSTLNGYIESDIYKDWPIWVAQYSSRCNYKHPWYMWQYTSSGTVKGIPGKVDLNWINRTEMVPHPVATYHGTLPVLPHRGWLTSGDKGEQVKRLQQFLNWYGAYGLDVDGIVGRKTIDAVRQYEGREKLRVDGAFGSECLKRARVVRR
mgnify:CR=1 FL=1